MRLVFVSTIAILVSCSAGFAQTTMSTPGAPAMVTSPLGMGPTSTAGPTGIPLGATELSNGGMSPAPVAPVTSGTNCFGSVYGLGTATGMTGTTGAAGMTGTGTATLNSTFDGGGSAGLSGGVPISAGTPSPSPTGSGSNEGCASLPGGGSAASAGTASPLSTPGNSGLTTLNGGIIPLGAIELGSPGLSPIIPVPGVTSTPCASTSQASGTAGLAMPSSAGAMGTTSMPGC